MSNSLGTRIRILLRFGLLPRRAPTVIAEGGSQIPHACAACDGPAESVEYELLFSDGRTVYFHRPCYAAWNEARAELEGVERSVTR